MEQGRDNIDALIYDSFKDVETFPHNDEQYKLNLKEKLHKSNDGNQSVGSFRTAAISLITAGFLIGFMYTTGMNTSLIHLEYKIKADYTMIKTNINIEKLFLGE